MKKCIMAFGAHADDIELQAGGTLAKYGHLGYKVIYVMVGNNASGCMRTKEGEEIPSKYYSPDKTTSIRKRETTEAAKVLGAEEIIFLDFKECGMWDKKEKKHMYLDFTDYNVKEYPPGKEPIVVAPGIGKCVDEVSDLIIQFEPKIVLTHSMDDENPEHSASCSLVYKAYRRAMEKVELGVLLSWEPGTAARVMGMAPDTYIDVSRFFAKKKEALYKQESQMNRCKWRWEYAEAKARFRAEEMDVTLDNKIKYAEAFRTLINAFILR